MFTDLPRPIIFAHRSASAHAPENKLASFGMALSQGAGAVELDTRLSADGRVVVIHDATVDHTTDGHGFVAQLTLTELRTLDSGKYFSEKYCGKKIPLLDEVFEVVGNRMFINIELKNCAARLDQLVETVCAFVKRHHLEKKVVFSSFLASNLNKARRLLPEVPCGLLALIGWKGAWALSFGFTFGDYLAMHPYLTDVTKQQVIRTHRFHRNVNVWTVNRAEDMVRLNHWGVDGIYTDDLQAAMRALGRSS